MKLIDADALRQAILSTMPERSEVLLIVDNQPEAIAMLKEQPPKSAWIHRADMDYKDKNGVVHFHGMCENCGFIHDFIDGHTGQYKFCPECGSKNEQWKDGDVEKGVAEIEAFLREKEPFMFEWHDGGDDIY